MNGKVKILIVDDRLENLVTLQAVLESLNIEVVEALSGIEALNFLMSDGDFALVILDVQMPEMDGFEVAKLMKQNKRTKDIPIIFVTAINKEQQYVFQGYASGAVDYTSKPFNPDILLCKVSIFIDLYLQKKQLIIKNIELQNVIDKMKLLQKEVTELREFVPICSSCHSIRNNEGNWQKFEIYFKEHTDSQVSHGLCPNCVRSLYPDFADKILNKGSHGKT